MRLVLSVLLAIVLLSGCGTSEAHFIYNVYKGSVTVIEEDVIFEYGGKTLTAKGEATKLEGANGDYVKIVRYSDGSMRIAN